MAERLALGEVLGNRGAVDCHEAPAPPAARVRLSPATSSCATPVSPRISTEDALRRDLIDLGAQPLHGDAVAEQAAVLDAIRLLAARGERLEVQHDRPADADDRAVLGEHAADAAPADEGAVAARRCPPATTPRSPGRA